MSSSSSSGLSSTTTSTATGAFPDMSRYTLSDEECARLSLPPNIGGLTVQLVPQCTSYDGTFNEITISCEDMSDEGLTITFTQNLTEISDLCGSEQSYPSRRYFDIVANLSRGVSSLDILRLLYGGEAIEQTTNGDYNRFKVLSRLHTPLNYFMAILRPVSNPDDELIVFPRVYIRSDSVELGYALNSPRTTQLNMRAVYANISGERVIAEYYQRINTTTATTDTTDTTTSTTSSVSSTIFTG